MLFDARVLVVRGVDDPELGLFRGGLILDTEPSIAKFRDLALAMPRRTLLVLGLKLTALALLPPVKLFT